MSWDTGFFFFDVFRGWSWDEVVRFNECVFSAAMILAATFAVGVP